MEGKLLCDCCGKEIAGWYYTYDSLIGVVICSMECLLDVHGKEEVDKLLEEDGIFMTTRGDD